MFNASSNDPDLKKSLLAISDRDELAWHVIDFGLMHDPDYAELAAMAAVGPGNHSKQLSAMIASPDEPDIQLSSYKPVPPPLPAEAYRFRPMSVEEQKQANPFYNGAS